MSLLKHMERWEDVKGYEGLYQVSNCGRVKSLNYNHTGNEKILKQCKNNKGYLYVTLYKECDKKNFYIHRLVANAFVINPQNLQDVNHKDEIKTNNYASNLEWCDSKYNVNYGTGMRRMLDSRTGPRKEKQILCVETNKVYQSSMEAKRQTGVHQQNIIKCCQGKRNQAGGYTWKYVN